MSVSRVWCCLKATSQLVHVHAKGHLSVCCSAVQDIKARLPETEQQLQKVQKDLDQATQAENDISEQVTDKSNLVYPHPLNLASSHSNIKNSVKTLGLSKGVSSHFHTG